jgi:hypothetical protein
MHTVKLVCDFWVSAWEKLHFTMWLRLLNSTINQAKEVRLAMLLAVVLIHVVNVSLQTIFYVIQGVKCISSLAA